MSDERCNDASCMARSMQHTIRYALGLKDLARCSLTLYLSSFPLAIVCQALTCLQCLRRKPPNASHASAPCSTHPSIVQHLPDANLPPIPSATFHPPAPSKNKRGGGFRKPVASRYVLSYALQLNAGAAHRYTKPAKPMKAMAKMPAVTSATGTPRMACGTSFSSSRSRMPAKTVSARAKPNAVETA